MTKQEYGASGRV